MTCQLSWICTAVTGITMRRSAGAAIPSLTTRAVALTHLVPAVPAAQAAAVFTQGREAFGGEVHVGADGMHFTLAGGTAEIGVGRLGAN